MKTIFCLKIKAKPIYAWMKPQKITAVRGRMNSKSNSQNSIFCLENAIEKCLLTLLRSNKPSKGSLKIVLLLGT